MATRLEDEIGVDLIFLNSAHITDFYFNEYQCSVIIELVHFSWGFSSNTYFKVCFEVQNFQSHRFSSQTLYYQIAIHIHLPYLDMQICCSSLFCY